MAIIKAFRGLRPKKGLEKDIASYPYDVISSEEARKIARGNKLSFLHVVKPEIDLEKGINPYNPGVYETAKKNLKTFIENGWLERDESELLYVYMQRMGSHTQYGLVVCTSCDDYDNDIIKKHEHTRKEKEDDRSKHIHITAANAGPVFLTYRAKPTIDLIIHDTITSTTPEYDFKAVDDINHTLWIVRDKSVIENLVKEFGEIDHLYVADGHHRAASGSRTRKIRKEGNPEHTGREEYNYFLSVLFPDNQLQIMPYNRVVRDIDCPEEKFLENIRKSFELSLSGQKTPREPHTICMYQNGNWYSLNAKEGSFPLDHPVKSLDTSILQDNLLAPILGIKDPGTDHRISFIGGIRGTGELERLVDSGKYRVAFSMYPARVDDIMRVADANCVMPPKSTWFEPKLRSGLIVHLLD